MCRLINNCCDNIARFLNFEYDIYQDNYGTGCCLLTD